MDEKIIQKSVAKSIDYISEKHQLSLEEPDIRRHQTCLSIIKGTSLLDVGAGKGILVNAAKISKKANKITALDIKESQGQRLKRGIRFVQGSILTEFQKEKYDTVTCMEVLEHHYSKDNQKILTNLRRAAKKRLILSVPFNEPEPLWWHNKPGGHRQKFTLSKLGELFPSAIATIEPRWGVDWIFLVEDKSLKNDEFKIITKDNFLELLA